VTGSGPSTRRGMLPIAGALLVAAAAAWWALRSGSADAGLARVPGDPAQAVTIRPMPPAPRAAPGEPQPLGIPGLGEAPGTSSSHELSPADPSVRFTGLVLDTEGKPVAGADVLHHSLAEWTDLAALADLRPEPAIDGTLARGTTGPDGRFDIAGRQHDAPIGGAAERAIPASVLFIRHTGLATAVLPCSQPSGSPPRFDAGRIVLQRGAAVSARVLDEAGAPVAGASLALALPGDGPPESWPWRPVLLRQALVGTSGADGRVRVEGLPGGRADFDCIHPAFVPLARAVELVAGATADLGDLVLARGAAIAGTVTAPDGRPIAGASVLLRVAELAGTTPDEDPVLGNLLIRTFAREAHDVRTRTDERGAFRAGTLDHERYAVFADAAGCEPAAAPAVAAGTSDLRLVLSPEAVLVLTVVDAAGGGALPGASVTAQRCHAPIAGRAASYGPYLAVKPVRSAAADGGVVLSIERPGAEGTQVRASAPGHASASFVLPGVAPGAQLEQTVALQAEIALQGRVIEPSGQPIAQAKVVFVPVAPEADSPRATLSAVTDAAGTFRVVTAAAGAWQATVSAGGWADSESQRIEAGSGSSPPPLVFMLQRGAYLCGSVRTASGGTPPRGVRVRIISPSGAPVSVRVGTSFGSDTATSIAVDPAGRWTCSRVLTPGTYAVSVIRPAGSGASAEAVLVGTSVRLAGGDSLDVPLVLPD